MERNPATPSQSATANGNTSENDVTIEVTVIEEEWKSRGLAGKFSLVQCTKSDFIFHEVLGGPYKKPKRKGVPVGTTKFSSGEML